MGHLGRLKDEYRELVGRLDRGAPALPEPNDAHAWQGWREILEILYTPEEAVLASKMPFRPTPLSQLAPRFGVSAAELAPRLNAMCDKGLVMDFVHPKTGESIYVLSPPVVGFIEFSLMRAQDSIPKKRMAEALHAYMEGDAAFAREVFSRETVIGRALVHETALADHPLPDVLDWQRATDIVGGAKRWSISLCFCRHKAQHLGEACGAEVEICMSLGNGAEFVARRGFGRSIERQEALDILARARAAGLVQIADNVMDQPIWICNCCGCCCEQLRAVSIFGLPAVNPSGFLPQRDEARCTGCSGCARACPVAAITMEPKRAAAHPDPSAPDPSASLRSLSGRAPGAPRKNALVPRFDLDRCIGCGVCADACRKHALRMKAGDKRPQVPAHSMEKVIRMALERNRLADLLFDQGAGLGSRFLHHAVDAITHLPPAQALLATEQLRSRFLKAALRGMS